MTDRDVVTNDDIRALMTEAGEAGDLEQCEDCRRALAGDTAARQRCIDAIEDAAAKADPTDHEYRESL